MRRKQQHLTSALPWKSYCWQVRLRTLLRRFLLIIPYLQALVDTFPLETLQALVQAIQVKFQESSQAREGGDLTW